MESFPSTAGWHYNYAMAPPAFAEREQVRACIARKDTEALTSEYIMAHTRTIRVAGN
jgi:hypothetical protein